MTEESRRNDEVETLTCRICLESAERAEVIAPCSCRGTSKYVHRDCLNRWRQQQPNRALTQCTECRANFRLRDDVSNLNQVRLRCCFHVTCNYLLFLTLAAIMLWIFYIDNKIHNQFPTLLQGRVLALLIYFSIIVGTATIREIYRRNGHNTGCFYIPTAEALRELHQNGHTCDCICFYHYAIVVLNCTVLLPVHIMVGFLTITVMIIPSIVLSAISHAENVWNQERLQSGQLLIVEDIEQGEVEQRPGQGNSETTPISQPVRMYGGEG